MTHALMIGETTFEIARVLSAVPTRDAETGEPRLDLHLVQGDGSDARVIVSGERAVTTIADIRRRRLTAPEGVRDQYAA